MIPTFIIAGTNLKQDTEMFLRSIGKVFCDLTFVLEEKLPFRPTKPFLLLDVPTSRLCFDYLRLKILQWT